MAILFTKPVFKETIWGGTQLKDEFGYSFNSNCIGESWALSAHPNGDCTVFSAEGNTPYEGLSLSELWNTHRELFGGASGDVFPLLIKFIDAKDDLSIQVHPDDNYAAEHENGAKGKTECWYILNAADNGTIVIGHNAKSADELSRMIDEHRWPELIRTVPVKKGDFLFIQPGCVHAIKGGTLLIEIQQSSDITYRLYDYDRLQNGRKRELHLDKAKDVITCPAVSSASTPRTIYRNEAGEFAEELVSCDYFSVTHIAVRTKLVFPKTSSSPYELISIIDGSGLVNDTKVKKGDNLIITNGCPGFVFEGNMELMLTVPGTKA